MPLSPPCSLLVPVLIGECHDLAIYAFHEGAHFADQRLGGNSCRAPHRVHSGPILCRFVSHATPGTLQSPVPINAATPPGDPTTPAPLLNIACVAQNLFGQYASECPDISPPLSQAHQMPTHHKLAVS